MVMMEYLLKITIFHHCKVTKVFGIYIQQFRNWNMFHHNSMIFFSSQCKPSSWELTSGNFHTFPQMAIHKKLFTNFYSHIIMSNVGKTTINHPPVITIFIGGRNHSTCHGWSVALFYSYWGFPKS